MIESGLTEIEWNDRNNSLLMFWRTREYFPFNFIAQLFEREFKIDVSKNSCISKYHKLIRKKGWQINYDLIADYLESPDPKLQWK